MIRDWVKKGLPENWNIQALDTGEITQTGGRILRCMSLFPGERIMATYGDGLSNVNIRQLIEFHSAHGKLATLTAVRPPARFGVLEISSGLVTHFGEKNQEDSGWINGGFLILEPEVAEYIKGDETILEAEVLPALSKMGELMAFEHSGFWQPMDTLREKRELNKLAALKTPPWLALN